MMHKCGKLAVWLVLNWGPGVEALADALNNMYFILQLLFLC
jgi:hypothetical protein